MICPECTVPMKTVDGSEVGKMTDELYETEELKICPNCGKRVREKYSAKIEVGEIKIN